MNRQEQIEKIKLEDKCRDFSWVVQQLKDKKLRLRGDIFTPDTFDEFRVFIKNVEEVYEGQWDIDIMPFVDTVDGKEETCYNISGIVIHFPEIDITNSRKVNHKVKDLFVRIELYIDPSTETLRIAGLSGGRMTISYAEYNSQYFHSHLPGSYERGSSYAPFYTSFCRGSGHINDFIADINSEGISQERLIPFLVQIMGLLSWESIEGGPHRLISNIRIHSSSGRRSAPSVADSLWLKNKVLTHCRETEIIPDIDFKFENNQYSIIDNDKFTNFLTETCTLTATEKKRVICMQDVEGNYYQHGSIPGYEAPPNTSHRKYIFQGRELTFEIESPPDIGDQTNIHYFLHPEVKNYIKQELEYEINIKKIRESTVEKYSDKASDNTESVRPDQVAV